MKDKTDCEKIQEMLDRLAKGELTEEERRAIQEHAAACPDCAMLLKIHAHCREFGDDELEAAVPDEMVQGMWPNVAARIAGKPTPSRPRLSRWRRALVPGLAAALFVLAFVCGFLVGELQELRQREGLLISELAASREMLEHYRQGAAAPRPAGRMPELGWRYILPEQEDFSVEELVSLLEQVPPQTSILSSGNALAFYGRAIPLRGVAGCTRREQVNMKDGLQAGEAVLLAKCLRLDPDTRISRERLVTFIENISGKGARS
jgi:hypothetical protein